MDYKQMADGGEMDTSSDTEREAEIDGSAAAPAAVVLSPASPAAEAEAAAAMAEEEEVEEMKERDDKKVNQDDYEDVESDDDDDNDRDGDGDGERDDAVERDRHDENDGGDDDAVAVTAAKAVKTVEKKPECSCCIFDRTVMDKFYKAYGGLKSGNTGSMDGTGSIAKLHALFELMKKEGFLGDGQKRLVWGDWGCGTGVFCAHLGIFASESVAVLGIESVGERALLANAALHQLGDLVLRLLCG
jgi:hypothetical protein